MGEVERFDMPGFYRVAFLGLPWLFGMATLAGVALPFVQPTGKIADIAVAVTLTLFFGWMTKGSIQILRHLPMASVSVDAEGFWRTLEGPETGRIPWSRVARVRERQSHQRLELLDASGDVLMRLEYALTGFERLREIVLERTAQARVPETLIRSTYFAPWWHHVLAIGLMLFFGAFGISELLGRGRLFLAVVLVIGVGVVGWVYWTTPWRLRIGKDALDIRFPGRRHVIRREDITSVEIVDELANGARRSHVCLYLRGASKPLALKGLRVPALDLMQVLRAWHDEGAAAVGEAFPERDVLPRSR